MARPSEGRADHARPGEHDGSGHRHAHGASAGREDRLELPRAPRARAVTCAVCELHAEAVFRVEGMDCNEEVVILERRLKPLDGMEAVSADVIGQRLRVQYDAAKLTTSEMVDAVGQTGMRMWLEHEQPRASASDVRARLWLTIASGVTIGAGLLLSTVGAATSAAVLFAVATVTGAVFPVRRAVAAFRTRTIDINVLMVIAVAGALALGEWLEAASVVFLFAVAQWLEVRTLERARQAIRALVDLSPRQATVKRDGAEVVLPIEELTLGDHVLVRPGEKVPVDGRVVAGHSDINEAPMTGESLPVDKAVDDEVFAGTINGRGALDVEVTRLGRDTRLARIIHLVEDAQSKRAPVQTFVDRFARVYTPVVIVLAAFVAAVPPLAAGADAATWFYRALVLLVIACPCALVISTPVSIVAALSAAARHGVLIKGGAHLERLAEIRVVAFDKTGTLTRGELRVVDVIPAGVASASEVLRYAAAVESRSEHLVARAIIERARERALAAMPVTAFVSTPGQGAEAIVSGRHVLVGNERLFAARRVEIGPVADDVAARAGSLSVSALRRRGRSVVFVAADDVLLGAIALEDRPRESAREAIELLRTQGVKHVVMLTGDHADSARAVADALAVDEHHAELLPEQKHALVQALRAQGAVLMVGDGVNDAPALAAADVGAAMGAAGTDAALETADVALMSDELLKLPYMLRLARATLRNIKTNVTVSLLLKAAFLVMAITGSATLWMAVLADTGASVIVVANALRLLRAR
jgi:Cd2+/Zn2+-exporting ATPase